MQFIYLFICNIYILIYHNQIYKRWADLQFHGLIKQVTFKDSSPEIINRTMVEEFPKINDCRWQILRPIDVHSNELIPFVFSGPITSMIMKL